MMVWQTDRRTIQRIIGLHRRQQLLFCSEICVHLDSERNYLLPGVRCWPHCQCSGDIDLLATGDTLQNGPMLQLGVLQWSELAKTYAKMFLRTYFLRRNKQGNEDC